MLCKENYTTKLIGLQGIFIKNISENEKKEILIELELKKKAQVCPCCGEKTSKIHDIRKQKVKDCSAFGKTIYLLLDKKRYVCKNCKKTFCRRKFVVAKISTTNTKINRKRD